MFTSAVERRAAHTVPYYGSYVSGTTTVLTLSITPVNFNIHVSMWFSVSDQFCLCVELCYKLWLVSV